MQFRPSYLLGLNELVGLAYVQNLGLLMKRAPGEVDSTWKLTSVCTEAFSVCASNTVCDDFPAQVIEWLT